jgi:hypothetical protein
MSIPYQYSALKEEAGKIRLLTLLPGKARDPTEILLEMIPLTDVSTPKYEALSYAQPLCDLKSGGRVALVRYEDRPRVLWIDAICVNQRDFGERSSQVKRMADIYSKAERVIIWLGTESEASELAFDLLRKIDANAEVDWDTTTFEEREGCSPQ